MLVSGPRRQLRFLPSGQASPCRTTEGEAAKCVGSSEEGEVREG